MRPEALKYLYFQLTRLGKQLSKLGVGAVVYFLNPLSLNRFVTQLL